jgi:hypothetical protein
VPDRFEAAAKKRRSLDFIDRLRARAARVQVGAAPVVVRLQPQRVAFAALGPRTAWMLSTWVFGAGASEAEAVAARRRGLDELAALCDEVSLEVTAREGTGGTPIPP